MCIRDSSLIAPANLHKNIYFSCRIKFYFYGRGWESWELWEGMGAMGVMGAMRKGGNKKTAGVACSFFITL